MHMFLKLISELDIELMHKDVSSTGIGLLFNKKKTKLESISTYIIESVKMILEFGEAFGEALKIAKNKNNMV